MSLNIYRGVSVNLTINIDDNTRLIRRLLGADIIKSSFNSHDILDIDIGDYIIHDSINYYINSLPNIKKNASNSFDYNITFESEYYELLKTQFMDNDGNSDFDLVGNLETFIDLIVTNMNRTHSGWAKGTCDQTNADYKLLNFSKANCMQVIQKLCDKFEGEFYFSGKDICFTDKTGSDSGLTFMYKQGLRNIQRNTLSEKNIITRLYAFGSEKNLASDYRSHSRRLKFVLVGGESYLEKYITATTWAAATAYTLGNYVEPTTPNDYIYECTTAGTSGGSEPTWGTTEGGTTADGTVVWACRVDPTIKYGIIEHTKIYNDIYPHREGTISAIDAGDITKLTDSGMDFNLNDYLLPGVTAKIHFNSGNLGGYEFEVSAYDNATKEFTIIKFADNQGYELPNATLKPAIGDKYVLLDIELPQSYIDTAEAALQAKAQDFIDDNCEPRVTYILEPDWRYFKTHFIDLEVGDYITIEDTDLNIDKMVRVLELTQSIANEYKYTLKLSDHLEVQLIQRLYEEQEDIQEVIEIGEGGDIIRSWRNWKTSEELRTMVYDTDGYFDMGNIRPASVQTSMLSVGAKSSQFILKGIEIEANYTGDKSKFHASAGSLVHLSIADEIRTWTLSENSQDSLTDGTAYYIYAKCTKEPSYAGQILVDETARKFDDDPTYYYFLIGVLHSVADEVRGISLTFGQTIINGKFIRTGKIESTDGLTYFDLDNSIIQGNIRFSSGMYYAKTFRQTTAPTSGMVEGDFWIDTNDGDKTYTYNGAIWVQAYTILNGGNIEAGSLTLVSAASDFNWSSLVDDGNKPDNNADVTGSNTAADIINLPATPAGAGLYATGTYLGYYDSASWKAYIQSNGNFYFGGDANNYIQWNGSSLVLKGSVTLVNTIPNAKVDGLGSFALISSLAYGSLTGTKPPSNADVTLSAIQGELSLAGGGLVLASSGAKIRGGQTAYGVGTGFWLGDVSGVSKFSIGSSTNWLKWTGSALQIKGRLYVGTGTTDDIYFSVAGIRIYDGGTSLQFLKIGGTGLQFVFTSGLATINTTSNTDLLLSASGEDFKFWRGGHFQMPNIASEPSHAGKLGSFIFGNNKMHVIRSAGCQYIQTTTGW